MDISIGIVVFPGFQLLDAAGPITVFEAADYFAGPAHSYTVKILSASGGPVASSAGVALQTQAFRAARQLDTLMVAGGASAHSRRLDPANIRFVQRCASRCRRMASVCTGAFLLARAGLLDGRRATTHWRHAGELARAHPRVRVAADSIWVNDDKYWTSAGVAAGIDLALALVTDDCGADVARKAAREIVVYYQRPGGQSQYSTLEELGAPRGRFTPLLAWIQEHIADPIRVEDLAAQAAMSPRNFSRRFRAETGRSPAQAVTHMRLEVARALIESTALPIDAVARRSGFGDSERMRRSFVKVLGQAPRALRTAAHTRS